jgi:hypothetical protein
MVTVIRPSRARCVKPTIPRHQRAVFNLATVLTSVGMRESGTIRLEEAVVAYREALKEITRERVPLDWTTIQNNLGADCRSQRSPLPTCCPNP